MSTPPESAPEAFPAEPLFRGRIIEMVNPPQLWRLEAFPGHLALFAPGETQPLIYPRIELAKKVELFQRPALLIIAHPRKVVFRFDSQTDLERVRDWMGPPSYEQMEMMLKRRYGWVFPVAFLFLFTSLPIGDPKENAESARFQPWSFTLGIWLVAMGLVARYRPHRVLFLFDALWFAALAGGQVWRIIRGDSLWWLLLVLLEAWMAFSGLELYRQFSRTRKV